MIQQPRRRYMHLSVHNSTIYNSQDMEAAYMSIDSAICSNMDGPRDDHTKWSKSEKERQIPNDITYMWNLKYDTNELIYKQKESAARVAAFPARESWKLGAAFLCDKGSGCSKQQSEHKD